MAKWILPEVDSSKAQRFIAQAASGGEELVALDLIFPEVANAIWKRHHRGLITLDKARSLLKALHRLPVRIEPAARLVDAAFEIAAKYHRSVYDALFVALMQERGIRGITTDEPLFNTTRNDFPELMLLRNL